MGVVEREKLLVQRDIALAWRVANFWGAAQGGKLKGLSTYLEDIGPDRPQSADEAAAVFQILAGQGKVNIREVPKQED